VRYIIRHYAFTDHLLSVVYRRRFSNRKLRRLTRLLPIVHPHSLFSQSFPMTVLPVAFLTALLCICTQLRLVQAVGYALTDNWVGESFFEAFAWEAISDPTHGRVNYISETQSRTLNLSYASHDSL
jgi:hypothetical protein